MIKFDHLNIILVIFAQTSAQPEDVTEAGHTSAEGMPSRSPHPQDLMPENDNNEQLIGNTKPKNVESPYEPYWDGGEWVYLRTTKKRRFRWKTTPKTTTGTGTQESQGSTTTPTTKEVNYDCQYPCLYIYEHMGVVCGQRFNGWEYEMKQFDDACDLYSANCINPTEQNRLGLYRGPWYILYKGPCYELTTPWVFPPTDITAIVNRYRNYASVVQYNKDQSITPGT